MYFTTSRFILCSFRVRPQIPVLKDVQPLLEMDRDERKLDAFLTFHRSRLLVSDLKVFLPFTINLDPYIKKKIKEEQQSMEEDNYYSMYKSGPSWQQQQHHYAGFGDQMNPNRYTRRPKLTRNPSLQNQNHQPPALSGWALQAPYPWQPPMWMPPPESMPKPLSATITLPVRNSIN